MRLLDVSDVSDAYKMRPLRHTKTFLRKNEKKLSKKKKKNSIGQYGWENLGKQHLESRFWVIVTQPSGEEIGTWVKHENISFKKHHNIRNEAENIMMIGKMKSYIKIQKMCNTLVENIIENCSLTETKNKQKMIASKLLACF